MNLLLGIGSTCLFRSPMLGCNTYTVTPENVLKCHPMPQTEKTSPSEMINGGAQCTCGGRKKPILSRGALQHVFHVGYVGRFHM